MGLFDKFFAQDANGAALRSGLLNAGVQMMAGANDPRNNGRFAPALAQGFAGFEGGMQQSQQMEMRRQMLAQQAQEQAAQAQLRALQTRKLERDLMIEDQANGFFGGAGTAGLAPSLGGPARPVPVGPSGTSNGASAGKDIDIDKMIAEGLVSPNAGVREWAITAKRLRQAELGGISGLVPTQSGYGYLNNGKFTIATNPDGTPVMPVSAAALDPTLQGQIAGAKAQGAATGKGQAEREMGAPAALAKVDEMERSIDNILNHPGLPSAVGWQGGLPVIPGTSQADFVTAAQQLEGQAFLQAFESLKGGGQITEVEGAKATQAIGRMSRSQSETEYKKSLQDLKEVLSRARERVQKGAGVQGPAATQPAPAGGGRPSLADIMGN